MSAELLMTGATGFVAAHFLPLMAEHGYGLGGLCRETSKRGHLDGLAIDWSVGDVTDGDSVDRAVARLGQRADQAGRPAWLVHGAAIISYRTGAELERVNVEGTRIVLEAAKRHGIDRVLVVSSVVSVGVAATATGALDEDADFGDVRRVTGAEFVSEYMRTKRVAEELCFGVEGLDVVVVNPGAIFGRAPVPSNTAQIIKRVQSSAIGRFAGPGSLSVVGAGDVANGMRLALERGRPGRRYLLTERNLRLKELLKMIQVELGIDQRLFAASPLVWRGLVSVSRLVERVRRLHVVTPTALELLGLHFRFDSTRAREELGWEPRPFEEVLTDTAAWLREIGMLEPGSRGSK